MGKTIIGIIAAVIIIAAGFFFFAGKAKAPAVGELTEENGAPQQATTATGAGQSLKELIGLGTAQRCAFDDAVTGGQASGTVYVGGGKVRTDFATQQGGKAVVGHSIVDAGFSYTWIDGMKDGFKVSVTPGAGQSGAPSGAQGIDMEAKIDYRCETWTLDASKFEPPANVTFRDMSAMMQGMPAGR
jgi:hypothetical protein